MSGPPNPKNFTNAAASDLGLASPELEDEEQKKKKLLQMQQERMGNSGTSVYGAASMSLFSDATGAGGGS